MKGKIISKSSTRLNNRLPELDKRKNNLIDRVQTIPSAYDNYGSAAEPMDSLERELNLQLDSVKEKC